MYNADDIAKKFYYPNYVHLLMKSIGQNHPDDIMFMVMGFWETRFLSFTETVEKVYVQR
jgi:hypothetical protein